MSVVSSVARNYTPHLPCCVLLPPLHYHLFCHDAPTLNFDLGLDIELNDLHTRAEGFTRRHEGVLCAETVHICTCRACTAWKIDTANANAMRPLCERIKTILHSAVKVIITKGLL